MKITRRHWRLYIIIPLIRNAAKLFWQTKKQNSFKKIEIPRSVSFEEKTLNKRKK